MEYESGFSKADLVAGRLAQWPLEMTIVQKPVDLTTAVERAAWEMALIGPRPEEVAYLRSSSTGSTATATGTGSSRA